MKPFFVLQLRPDFLHDCSATILDLLRVVTDKLSMKNLKLSVSHNVLNAQAMRVEEIVEWFGRNDSAATQKAADIDCAQIGFGSWCNAAKIVSP